MPSHSGNGKFSAYPVFEVDRYFAQLTKSVIGDGDGSIVPPYAIVGEAAETPLFDHAFAGVVAYIIEAGVFLLQKRDGFAPSNPNRISIFGGRVRPGELPSAAAVREFAEETGIKLHVTQLKPMRAYVERSIVVPVFRAIFTVMLDRLPEIKIGEGAGFGERSESRECREAKPDGVWHADGPGGAAEVVEIQWLISFGAYRQREDTLGES